MKSLSLGRNKIIFLEPGYYEDGKFGIRLETDIEVVKANTSVILSLDLRGGGGLF